MLQGGDFVTWWRFPPAGPKDAPPGDRAAIMAHHCADLPRPAGSQKLCDVTVGNRRTRRNKVHNGQNRCHILHPHVFSVTAGVSCPNSVGPSR